MAEFRNGANGTFSGKVGSVIGSNWRDINYIRGLSKKSSKPATAKQLLVQKKFVLLANFLFSVRDAVDLGFSNKYTGRATTLNLAMTANKEAFVLNGDEPQLNYPEIVLSSGRMVVKPEDCAIVMDGPNSVKVSWDVNAEPEFLGKRIGDKATIVLYCADRESPLIISGQYTRVEKGAVIRIPGSWQGTDVHTYVFMTSEEGKNSETVFAGTLPVA